MRKWNWKEEWKGMPEYNNPGRAEPEITATFKFRNKEDYDEFHSLVKEHVFKGRVFDGMQKNNAKQAWFPRLDKASNYLWVDEEKNHE